MKRRGPAVPSSNFCGCDHCQRFRREQDARDRRRIEGRARVAAERAFGERFRNATARDRVAMRRANPGVDFDAIDRM
jgi:hypothetical protein